VTFWGPFFLSPRFLSLVSWHVPAVHPAESL
jgi:hypothetical protein